METLDQQRAAAINQINAPKRAKQFAADGHQMSQMEINAAKKASILSAPATSSEVRGAVDNVQANTATTEQKIGSGASAYGTGEKMDASNSESAENAKQYAETGHYAQGSGVLKGPGTTTSDSIPAKLSKGEAVLNSNAVLALQKMLGDKTIEQFNAEHAHKGVVSKVLDGVVYAAGGYIPDDQALKAASQGPAEIAPMPVQQPPVAGQLKTTGGSASTGSFTPTSSEVSAAGPSAEKLPGLQSPVKAPAPEAVTAKVSTFTPTAGDIAGQKLGPNESIGMGKPLQALSGAEKSIANPPRAPIAAPGMTPGVTPKSNLSLAGPEAKPFAMAPFNPAPPLNEIAPKPAIEIPGTSGAANIHSGIAVGSIDKAKQLVTTQSPLAAPVEPPHADRVSNRSAEMNVHGAEPIAEGKNLTPFEQKGLATRAQPMVNENVPRPFASKEAENFAAEQARQDASFKEAGTPKGVPENGKVSTETSEFLDTAGKAAGIAGKSLGALSLPSAIDAMTGNSQSDLDRGKQLAGIYRTKGVKGVLGHEYDMVADANGALANSVSDAVSKGASSLADTANTVWNGPAQPHADAGSLREYGHVADMNADNIPVSPMLTDLSDAKVARTPDNTPTTKEKTADTRDGTDVDPTQSGQAKNADLSTVDNNHHFTPDGKAAPYSEQRISVSDNGDFIGVNSKNPRSAESMRKMADIAKQGIHAGSGAGSSSSYPVNSDGYRAEQAAIVQGRHDRAAAFDEANKPVQVQQAQQDYQAPDFSGAIAAAQQELNTEGSASSFDDRIAAKHTRQAAERKLASLTNLQDSANKTASDANNRRAAATQNGIDNDLRRQGLAQTGIHAGAQNALTARGQDIQAAQNKTAAEANANQRAELKAQHEATQGLAQKEYDRKVGNDANKPREYMADDGTKRIGTTEQAEQYATEKPAREQAAVDAYVEKKSGFFGKPTEQEARTKLGMAPASSVKSTVHTADSDAKAIAAAEASGKYTPEQIAEARSQMANNK